MPITPQSKDHFNESMPIQSLALGESEDIKLCDMIQLIITGFENIFIHDLIFLFCRLYNKNTFLFHIQNKNANCVLQTERLITSVEPPPLSSKVFRLVISVPQLSKPINICGTWLTHSI